VEHLKEIVQHFVQDQEVSAIETLGSGNVHDTFLVSFREDYKIVLQCMNRRVFPNAKEVMDNMELFFAYCHRKMAEEKEGSDNYFRLPKIIKGQDGENFWVDDQGNFWRVFSYLDNTTILTKIDSYEQAKEVGRVLGYFHRLAGELDTSLLHDTLPGFHITPLYLSYYDRVSQALDIEMPGENVQICHRCIEKRRSLVSRLEQAREKGKLTVRTIHGDPKLANILFDQKREKAVCLIDLDTVKPGLFHYDIGDCLRSCCNQAGAEDVDALDRVQFDVNICRAVLEGYQAEAGPFLSPLDYDYLYDAIRLLPFELGLRFFTDYLEGNVYFKTDDDEQNLRRALVQFHLVQSIEKQEEKIRCIIDDLCGQQQS
jgi:Ser/Thr protein kinase RdoA (MazF antagonist)